MTKDQTAIAIIRLALENGVPSTKLESFINSLIRVSPINPSYIDGLFRAYSLISGYNQVLDIEHELHGNHNID